MTTPLLVFHLIWLLPCLHFQVHVPCCATPLPPPRPRPPTITLPFCKSLSRVALHFLHFVSRSLVSQKNTLFASIQRAPSQNALLRRPLPYTLSYRRLPDTSIRQPMPGARYYIYMPLVISTHDVRYSPFPHELQARRSPASEPCLGRPTRQNRVLSRNIRGCCLCTNTPPAKLNTPNGELLTCTSPVVPA